MENTTGEERFIEIPLIGYMGYGLDCDGADTIPYIAEQRGQHGDLRIAVPGGYQGNIRVSYQGLISFRIAEWISIITLLGIVAYAVRRRFVSCKREA